MTCSSRNNQVLGLKTNAIRDWTVGYLLGCSVDAVEYYKLQDGCRVSKHRGGYHCLAAVFTVKSFPLYQYRRRRRSLSTTIVSFAAVQKQPAIGKAKRHLLRHPPSALCRWRLSCRCPSLVAADLLSTDKGVIHRQRWRTRRPTTSDLFQLTCCTVLLVANTCCVCFNCVDFHLLLL